MNFKNSSLLVFLLVITACFTVAIAHAKSAAVLVNPVVATLMLDPAGDAKHAGRIIEDSFERGISLVCAQEIKQQIQSAMPNLRVILTRSAGESVEPLQNASFANRLRADMYLSIHFYQTHEPLPQVTIYQLVQHPVTDFWQRKEDSLIFQPYDQAHRKNIDKTARYGTCLLDSLKQLEKQHKFQCIGFFHVPFRPLLGISAPALALEIGLAHKDDWKKLIPAIIQAIKEIITMPLTEFTHETSILPAAIS